MNKPTPEQFGLTSSSCARARAIKDNFESKVRALEERLDREYMRVMTICTIIGALIGFFYAIKEFFGLFTPPSIQNSPSQTSTSSDGLNFIARIVLFIIYATYAFVLPIVLGAFAGAAAGAAFAVPIRILREAILKPKYNSLEETEVKNLARYESALWNWNNELKNTDNRIISEYGKWLEHISKYSISKGIIPKEAELPNSRMNIEAALKRAIERERTDSRAQRELQDSLAFLTIFNE